MKEFENGWPKNFNDKFSRVVKTQADSGKYIKVSDTKVCIQESSREININQLLSYELSPLPTAMFSESSEMKVAMANSVLKKV